MPIRRTNTENIIENTEKSLFDLAERGSFPIILKFNKQIKLLKTHLL